MRFNMGKNELYEINDGWDFEMINDGYHQFMTYQPFTDEYWNQKNKIVFCNLESYDETLSGVLDLEVYKKWLLSGSATIKYSSLFIAAIVSAINGKSLTESELKNNYHNNDYLLDSIKNVTYMNLRKEANTIRKEDTKAIHEFLDPNYTRLVDNKHHIRNFRDIIKALEPNILIVSGKTGADIFSKIYKDEMKFVYDQFDYLENTLCVSVSHPSTSKCDYSYIISKSDFIAQELKKINLTTAST